jgi:hypothetical protein
MKLGSVAPGVIHTFRYFRGTQVVHNNKGEVVIEMNPRGGICFLFEIDYNHGHLLFTAAIADENDQFDKTKGRLICEDRAARDSGKTFKIAFDESEPLLDQLFIHLLQGNENGELVNKPHLRTLLDKMKLYDQQNADAMQFYEDMIQNGVIFVPED